ncbi:MAG: hypothetical protein HY718_04065, partial [Planctomycetes bacterium]|nr:hypothetical protein [Planctomycetota bacterium]
MGMQSILRVVGSLKFAAVILVLLSVAMACATVYEAMHGTPAALLTFYKSAWFETLLWLLGVNMLGSMLSRYPWSRRHVGLLATHLSVLSILTGAFVTKQWGIDGLVSIVEGRTARQFTTSQESLTLRVAGTDTPDSLDLKGGIGGIRPVSRPATGSLVVGDVRAEIEGYLPDGRKTDRVVNDSPRPKLALEVSLAGSGKTSRDWVFAGERQNPDEVSVSLRTTTQPAEIDQLLAAPASQPAPARLVKVEAAGSTVELPLERCLAGPVPVGETGYAVHVLRYLPHAIVGDNKQLVDASQRPVNPAIEVEINGPSGKATRTVFARFPDFGAMHGTQDPSADVKVTLIVPPDATETTPIEIVAGPNERLAARFRSDDGTATVRELTVGQAVETAWP